LGFELPKGASAEVKSVALRLIRERGADALGKVAKLHFRTANEVMAEAGRGG
jgi:ribonuclease HIII